MQLCGKAMHLASANFATTANCNFSHQLVRTLTSSQCGSNCCCTADSEGNAPGSVCRKVNAANGPLALTNPRTRYLTTQRPGRLGSLSVCVHSQLSLEVALDGLAERWLCKLLILRARVDLLIFRDAAKSLFLLTKMQTNETSETRPSRKALKTWSHPPGSNRRPADYESAALPTELGWPTIGCFLYNIPYENGATGSLDP